MLSFHDLRDFRLFMPNPGFLNPSWAESDFHALILRLSPFADVDRSTPHLLLFQELRRAIPECFIDMAFLPSREDLALLETNNAPLVMATQSRRHIGAFDLVMVSNSYLLELVNLPFLLSGSGIPLWAGERGEEIPPIILGGSNSAAAHAISSPAGDCMADAIFFGEGEERAGEIARILMSHKSLSKRDRISRAAAEVDGLWAPGGGPREVRKAVCGVEAMKGQSLAYPVLPGPEASTARLAITLGCPYLCAFCFEGHDRKPFREIPLASLLAAARELKARTGARTLEIASFNFNTHSGLPSILEELNRLFLKVNMMSQRADVLAGTPGLLALELAADKRSYTLGIEGISERLRRYLHKSLGTEEITRALEALHQARIREIKLFYLLTGREQEEDFAELGLFLRWLKTLRSRLERAPRIIFSFGSLVRMPFTPLRYEGARLGEKEWRALAGRVKSVCQTNGFEFRMAASWPEFAATQILALADWPHELALKLARLGPVTEAGLPAGGEEAVDAWIAERGAELASDKPPDHPFAFSFLETQREKDALWRQFEQTKAGREGKVPGSRLTIEEPSVRKLRELMDRKRRLSPLYLMARIPRQAAGMGPEWLDAWLMRSLIEAFPDEIENILSARESLVEPWDKAGRDTAWFGRTVVALAAWDTAALAQSIGRGQERQALFQDVVPYFTPGEFSSADLRLSLPREVFPAPAPALLSFMQGEHVPITLRRRGSAFVFEVAEKAVRKRALLGGECQEGTDCWKMDLRIGPRFALGDFLASFGEPGAAAPSAGGAAAPSAGGAAAPSAGGAAAPSAGGAAARPAGGAAARCASVELLSFSLP